MLMRPSSSFSGPRGAAAAGGGSSEGAFYWPGRGEAWPRGEGARPRGEEAGPRGEEGHPAGAPQSVPRGQYGGLGGTFQNHVAAAAGDAGRQRRE